MSDVKISAIMPVYNVEKFIGKCIESLQAQTLTEWELIAVDDGSPDNSGAICDAYALKDSRIKVIHKENGGAPSARNTAIPMARGEYLYFVDSDDWAEPTMFQDMYNMAKKNNSKKPINFVPWAIVAIIFGFLVGFAICWITFSYLGGN